MIFTRLIWTFRFFLLSKPAQRVLAAGHAIIFASFVKRSCFIVSFKVCRIFQLSAYSTTCERICQRTLVLINSNSRRRTRNLLVRGRGAFPYTTRAASMGRTAEGGGAPLCTSSLKRRRRVPTVRPRLRRWVREGGRTRRSELTWPGSCRPRPGSRRSCRSCRRRSSRSYAHER